MVRGIDGIEPGEVLTDLSSDESIELSVAAHGYPLPDGEFGRIEDAVEWRGHAEKAGRILVFLKSDAAKMHSLGDFEEVTSRDLAAHICLMARDHLSPNEPHKRFWQAVGTLVDTIPLSLLEEFVDAVESASDSSSALGTLLWKLGFLPDSKILDAVNVSLDQRLLRNRYLLSKIGQLSEQSRKRLGAVLTRQTDEANGLRSAYRDVMSFFRYGDKATLARLDYAVVEQLLEAGKLRRTPEPELAGTEGGAQPEPEQDNDGPLKGAALQKAVADRFLSTSDEDESALSDLADHIDQLLTSPEQAPTEFVGDGFDGRSVQLKVSPELRALNELMGFACSGDSWGGILSTSKSDIKSAVRNWSPESFQKYNPEDPNQGVSDRSVFDLIRGLDEQLGDNRGLASAVEDLIASRAILSANLPVILANPLAAFGGRPAVRDALDGFLTAFGNILHLIRSNYADLAHQDQLVIDFVSTELLRLEVIHIETPTEWKAILTPLHPFHLWRFREIIKSARSRLGELNEEEHDQLVRALPNLPHLLHFVVFSPEIGGGDIKLPQSGAIELLPTYENKTNRYLGVDGLDTLPTLLSRWADFAPYSEIDVKVSVVDPPDIPMCVSFVSDFVGTKANRGASLTIYLGRGQDATAEMLRLDLVNEHQEVGEQISSSRLRIKMVRFDGLQDLARKLESAPSHLVLSFDQSQYQLGHATRARELVVSPLVVAYEYRYSPALKRGEIAPSSEAHEGLFADYHFLVERAASLPAGQQIRLQTQAGETVAALNGLLESGAARWLAIADRVLTPYAPRQAVPLTEQRVGNRELGVWTSQESYAVQRLVRLLRGYNLNPQSNVVAELLKSFGHITANGILSLPLVGGNAQSRDAAEKGLLGSIIAAAWYRKRYPGSLIASLDSGLARIWLASRGSEKADRADLIGIRADGDKVVIEPIEVKARADDDAAHVEHIPGSRRLVGKAIQQLEAMIKLLEPIFGLAEWQALLTPARREALRYQLFRECFKDVHEHELRSFWYAKLQEIFSISSCPSNVELRGLALHVVFEQGGLDEEFEDLTRPLSLVRLKTNGIQALLIEGNLSPFPEIQLTEPIGPVELADENGSPKRPDESAPIAPLEDARAETTIETAPQHRAVSLDESVDLSRRFLRACQSYRILVDSCDPTRAVQGPTVWRFYVRLKPGQQLKDLRNKLEDIGREMGRSGLIVTTVADSQDVALDVPRTDRARVLLMDHFSELPDITSPEQMPVLIGVTPEGTHVVRDLSRMPHLLVGGTTGSGKTMFLYSVILALLSKHPNPNDLRLVLSTSGPEDFVFFEDLPHLEGGAVIEDANLAVTTLQMAVSTEAARRKDILTNARCRDIIEYNERNRANALPPFVVIVDEFADLTDQFGSNRAARETFYANVRQIAQIGRKRGIHLVLCTQRPSAELVPTSIRSLLNGRVGLHVNDGTASKMILDEVGAENLQMHGDMLFKEHSVIRRAQGYFVSTHEIEEQVRSLH
ncbi:MAG: FtsK/SpoIIIE domain-containing protein [bacterium]|nr:FtsK/SpoIIIE domain-containing protein [bacterium]